MWISARTATTLAAAALLLVMVAVAAPLLPRPSLPSLPEECAHTKAMDLAKATPTKVKTSKVTASVAPPSGNKLGAASEVLDSPDRVRAQRMEKGASALAGAARWDVAGRVGTGVAVEPNADAVRRLITLLQDARTVADPRAIEADPTLVVRLVKGDHKLDVMMDAAHDRLVLALDGQPAGTYNVSALHREFAKLGDGLFEGA